MAHLFPPIDLLWRSILRKTTWHYQTWFFMPLPTFSPVCYIHVRSILWRLWCWAFVFQSRELIDWQITSSQVVTRRTPAAIQVHKNFDCRIAYMPSSMAHTVRAGMMKMGKMGYPHVHERWIPHSNLAHNGIKCMECLIRILCAGVKIIVLVKNKSSSWENCVCLRLSSWR